MQRSIVELSIVPIGGSRDRLHLGTKKNNTDEVVCYFFIIGGSPAPPNCPMRRLESCSKGCSVCGLISRCLLRFDVFFWEPACLPLFFAFGIESPLYNFPADHVSQC